MPQMLLALLLATLLACTTVPPALAPTDVPPPFEPVRAWTDPSPTVAVWGREYSFASGPLPDRIVSQGTQLLAAPPEFRVAGQALRWSTPELMEATPEAAVLTSSASQGDLQIQARTTVEYDGMIRVDLSIDAKRPERIPSFEYELRLPRGVARWFNHHVAYDYQNLNVDKSALLASAGAFPTRLALPFTPSVSIANRNVGIEWWSETNVGWSRFPTPLELASDAEQATFRVRPLTAPQKVGPGQPWRDTFAIFPMPLRPPPPGWRGMRFAPFSSWRRFVQRDDLRYVWIAFPKHFSARYHGIPGSKGDSQQRALRARVERAGFDYIPYAKLTAVPGNHPLAMRHFDEWAANRQLYTGTGGQEAAVLRKTTNWKPGTPFGYAACMGKRPYWDWILEESVSAYRDEQLDGLYYDFGSITRMCELDPRVVRKNFDQVWDYFSVREFYKELHARTRAIDPRGLLTTHTHGQPRALAGFVDFVFIGEALNVPFRTGHSWKQVRQNPSLYVPDYLALPEGWLDAQIFPIAGGVTSILPEIKYAADPKRPERVRAYQRRFFAYTLVNDVHIWMGNSDFDELTRVYAALDRFGSLEDATLLPWWSNEAIAQRDPRLRVTLYAGPDRVLALVSNLTNRPVTSEIRLDEAAIGSGSLRRARDLEQITRRVEGIRAGALSVTVPPGDFRILQLE